MKIFFVQFVTIQHGKVFWKVYRTFQTKFIFNSRKKQLRFILQEKIILFNYSGYKYFNEKSFIFTNIIKKALLRVTFTLKNICDKVVSK